MSTIIRLSFWKEFRFLSHAISLVLFFVVSSMAFSSMFGVIEGDISPVIADFAITKMEPNGFGTTLIWGTLERERDCAYERLNFRHGDSKRNDSVEVRVMTSARKKELGPDTFGPWQVNLDQYEIIHNAMATIEHSCHPGWNTTSHLFANNSLFYGPPAPN